MKRFVPLIVLFFATVASVLLAVGVNAGTSRMLALPEDAELLPLEEAPEGAKPPPPRPRKPLTEADADKPPEEGDAPDAGPIAASDGDSPRPVRGMGKDAYIRGIMKRNIFDSTKVGKDEVEGPGGPIVSDLSVRLVSTIVADPSEYSSAWILDNGTKKTLGYAVGDKLEDAEITLIEERQVTIKRGNGTIEVLTMDSDSGDKTASSSDSAPAPAGDASTTEGITKESETKYTVERSVLDKYLGDLEGLSKMARAMPHKGADGSTDGYRLSGIRRNSPLYALGIRNGDVVHSVNGTSLADPAAAMQAFQSLSSTSNFNFDITRRNNPVTMEYSVK